eukprot:TRINITY_DN45519_c0_g1_i1.p1 TRINITY_DN45519_c0_g1~~TRINITY_DN45519_c0_g1_i1.p1  ORF type:complete len:281 (+),score=84.86 TRINITY_DN45519_c0_g1_i1:98-940(+)
MDPAQCLQILQQHSVDHAKAGCPLPGCGDGPDYSAGPCGVCGGNEIMAGYGADGNGMPMPGDEDTEGAEARSLPQGQILNVETGVNESLEGLDMEAFFKEFPDLREEPADDASGEERQLKRPRSDSNDAEEAKAASVGSEQALAEMMQSLETVALLERLLLQHKRRVAVHKAYDAAFRKCLQRGATVVALVYPQIVAAATKRFVVISTNVRAVAQVLEKRGRDEREAGELVRKLQGLEKEKLNLVAALHLDRVRWLQPKFGPDPGPGANGALSEFCLPSC